MQRTQCSVMQSRRDAWTLATQSWWTLSTHAVAFSASKSLTLTWTSILTKELGRNQDATDPISPVGLFVLMYTCPCIGPQNGAEVERWIVNHNTLTRAVSRRQFTADSRARSYSTLLQVYLQSGTGLGFLFRELRSFPLIIISHMFHTHISFIHIARINAPLTCPASFSAALDPFRIPLRNSS